MNAKMNLNRSTKSAKLKKVLVVLVIAAAIVQGIFFYCVLFQYNTYGTPSAYEYHIDYDEWIDMIEQEQIKEHNWFLDNTLGINLVAVLAILILFAVMVSLAKEDQVTLSGVKQTAIATFIVYVSSVLIIRFTADMFRLYMDFMEAEIISSAVLIFCFLNRRSCKVEIGI